MRKLLTDKSVLALKPARARCRYIVGDVAVPGLGVRVTSNGHKTFVLGARFPGSKHFVRRELGEVGAITLAAAREKAREWLVAIKRGDNPTKRPSTVLLNDTTFAHVAEAFIARHLAGQRKGARVAREIRNELIPRWGQLPIAKITRQMVVELVEAVADRGRTGRHAHNVYGHVRQIFNWAIARSIYGLEVSPCDRLRPTAILGQKRVRTRVLNDDELRALWQASDHYPYGMLVRLLVLVGARLNEIAGARWDEVDFSRCTLTIPAARFKGNSTHVIPLSDDAIALLKSLPNSVVRRISSERNRSNEIKHSNEAFESEFIFTSSGVRPVRDFHNAKLRLDRASGVMNWCFHDLRRTCRTRLAELWVPDQVAELVLGHGKRGLRRVYDQYGYADEVRAALEAWAVRLRSIVDPETKVIHPAAFRQ
jgi:integrase